LILGFSSSGFSLWALASAKINLHRPNSSRKTEIIAIPFTVDVHGELMRAARRGISLFLRINQREIPHFVRNDKINYFFRSL
jgi:hypothetical protein